MQLKDAELKAIAFSTVIDMLENYQASSINEAKELLKAVNDLDNTERLHMTISNFTPNQIHHSKTKIQIENFGRIITEKNYYSKLGNGLTN